MNTIGERIRILREEAGYSQSDLAEILGLNRMTITNYETNKRSPDLALASEISKMFNVTLEYLTGKTEFRNKVDMLDGVQKSERLISVIATMPQSEAQQMLDSLCSLLEKSEECDMSTPTLIGLISAISSFSRIIDRYCELNENIVRTVAELRWQKIQPPLIQWTCFEKTKAVNEYALNSTEDLLKAFDLFSKMANKKLLTTLETESEK